LDKVRYGKRKGLTLISLLAFHNRQQLSTLMSTYADAHGNTQAIGFDTTF
jgi:hypothetical protein